MPANPKYLTKSISQKTAKLTAGIIGGFFISGILHYLVALWSPYEAEVLATSKFTFFVLWATLMVLAYIPKNGWIVFLIYTIVIVLLSALHYLNNIS